MTTSTLKNLPKNTVELEISIPWSDIKSTYDEVLQEVIKEAELPGFRKGKAPKNLVVEKVDKTKIYEEVIKKVVPKSYAESVKTHSLKPISSPKVEVLEAKEGNDWKIKALVAQKPKVNLKNYKEKISKLNREKAVKIWLPGQAKEKNKEAESKKPTLDEIMSTLLSEVDAEVSDLLVDEEANRLLSNLLDQTQKLGMTVEQYLTAKGKTTESIRAEYAKEAQKNLTLELALAEIADSENIIVTDEDINKLIEKATDSKEKEKLKSQSYYLAHLLRQQKTIDFLYSL
ncbi:hypothetical protein A2773_00860 [Candidatus Gottesmanbacteria bacterium RIFCSPHIGHO2_01_FULL_39_10]|uniref:Trigger factor n=1 Tax=Candidatus Gottesmanbacteria bacterium RIFCSPHIGHO2_01_FULL_39_10 TaxID=1798375 RepID=A0A1F5ZLM5_9BACT|nr:MAG: hypothetical protein A2773_00860 [Candidatus Gottesmanbacteria bacterium RIFCSPHIGHO2_01_FULL_39_10]